MQMSEQGLGLTKSFEECRLTSYKDGGGVWTLGWGHTAGVAAGQTCSQEQADAWLEYDVETAAAAVNMYTRVELQPRHFDVLADFVYNLGVGAFRSSTLLKMVNEKDWEQAGEELLRWDHDGGVKVAGLTRRCEARKKLFLTGVFP